jgi:hypothetical protein
MKQPTPAQVLNSRQRRQRRAALDAGSRVKVEMAEGQTLTGVVLARSFRGYLVRTADWTAEIPSERVLLPDDGG